MRLFPRRTRQFDVRPLQIEDSLMLADLHTQDSVRPWSDAEFEALLSQETVFGFGGYKPDGTGGRAAGFVLARRAGGEAEILSIAVDRSQRRQGLGQLLMEAVLRQLYADRIKTLFLEVDEKNSAAISLYRRLRFLAVGERPDYYRDRAGRRSGALVMRRDLA